MEATEQHLVRNGMEFVPFEVDENNVCVDCYFRKRFYLRRLSSISAVCYNLRCLSCERKDKKNIIWLRKPID